MTDQASPEVVRVKKLKSKKIKNNKLKSPKINKKIGKSEGSPKKDKKIGKSEGGILKNKLKARSENILNKKNKKLNEKKVKLAIKEQKNEIKQKKNENNQKSEETSTEQSFAVKSFADMGVDDRILEGIAQLRWRLPTRAQLKTIPFVMRGKNMIVEARTGSGKTGAFLIPAIHKALRLKGKTEEQRIRVLVLAPSKELCRQIAEMAEQLCVSCSREIRVLDLSAQVPLNYQKPLLAELPDVVVGPPGRVLMHVQAGNLPLDHLHHVVVDEADLMTTFQYAPALEQLWGHMPEQFQCFVTSATMSADLSQINAILFRNDRTALLNTVILRFKDQPLPPLTQLQHYVIKLKDELEKVVLVYALYKLKKITGKTIIFVNSHTSGYRLRMCLGTLGLSSCLLNSELPVESRCHIIEQFNAGKYDIIIATDDQSMEGDKDDRDEEEFEQEKDKESGTCRGLDFQFVSNIINFEFPKDMSAYIHRVGRTARGTNQGSALSLVATEEHDTFTSLQAQLSELMTPKGKEAPAEEVIKKYVFDLSQLDGFRYRANDAWRICTRQRVLTARKKELIQEMRRSKKLMSYFKANPKERGLLRHSKGAHGCVAQPHLAHVPDYIIPDSLRASSNIIAGRVHADGQDDHVETMVKQAKKQPHSFAKGGKGNANANRSNAKPDNNKAGKDDNGSKINDKSDNKAAKDENSNKTNAKSDNMPAEFGNSQDDQSGSEDDVTTSSKNNKEDRSSKTNEKENKNSGKRQLSDAAKLKKRKERKKMNPLNV